MSSPAAARRYHCGQDPPTRRDVTLPDGRFFAQAERAAFTFTMAMTAGELVAMLGTYSGLITASPAERARALGRARTALMARFRDITKIDVPMRSVCWRADQARSGRIRTG